MTFLRLAWRNVLRNTRRSTITITAIAIGLAALIFLWAFMDGVNDQMIENSTRYVSGHIQVHRAGYHEERTLDLLLADEWFDVVLCDVVMPETSGIDLYQRVREKHPEQADRFIFMTGGAFTQRMRRFLEETENPRLEKPFSHQRLNEVLEAVHPRKAPLH